MTRSAAAPAVELRDIAKKFGHVVAIGGVSLVVHDGEFVCFLGPSGCGKTTLLRIIAGLERQNAGTVLMRGRDVSGLPPSQRNYGIVFQSYALFPNLTVAGNVAYGLETRHVERARIEARVAELLDLVHLPAHKDRYPAQLSGGEQQRVALARALAPSPSLLLLDEPLSALDARVRLALRQEIKSLQKRLGITTIMVTHDQEEALAMADRIVVMNHGVIEQIGSPHDVYERPATPFVADFVGKVNVLPAVALGNGRFQVSRLELECAGDGSEHAPGTPVRLYLRPEDRAVEGALDGAANRVHGRVTKVEFLGGSCLAEMSIEELDGLPLHLYFSLNQLHDLGVQVGAQLEVALRSDRIRVFGAKEARQ
jgi:iron(III) transport system ATP-binding protein